MICALKDKMRLWTLAFIYTPNVVSVFQVLDRVYGQQAASTERPENVFPTSIKWTINLQFVVPGFRDKMSAL